MIFELSHLNYNDPETGQNCGDYEGWDKCNKVNKLNIIYLNKENILWQQETILMLLNTTTLHMTPTDRTHFHPSKPNQHKWVTNKTPDTQCPNKPSNDLQETNETPTTTSTRREFQNISTTFSAWSMSPGIGSAKRENAEPAPATSASPEEPLNSIGSDPKFPIHYPYRYHI